MLRPGDPHPWRAEYMAMQQVRCSNRESISKTSIAFSPPLVESEISH